MRIAAIRGTTSGALGADPPRTGPPRTDALVPGTRFHAAVENPCTQAAGEPMRQCRFGVVRLRLGRAEVTVLQTGGSSRTIGFEGGQPVRFGGAALAAEAWMTIARNGVPSTVSIGPERCEIPEASVSGGWPVSRPDITLSNRCGHSP